MGEFEEDVPEAGRYEHASIEYGREYSSSRAGGRARGGNTALPCPAEGFLDIGLVEVVKPGGLGALDHLVEGGGLLVSDSPLVVEEIRELDPPVSAWSFVGDLTLVEHPDQGGPADAQQVGGLLSRQRGVHWRHGHGQPTSHRLSNSQQDLNDLGG